MNYEAELSDYIEALSVRNGSDIHLISDIKPAFRVDRELIPFVQKEPLTKNDVEGFFNVISKNTERGLDFLQDNKSLKLRYTFTTQNGNVLNFRVTAYIEKGNIAIAMRAIQTKIPLIEELNLPPILKNIMAEPSGLFLVVGAAGHGKSTTLASMLEYCNNTYRKHIITIEDPIEFLFESKKSIISQREVPDDAESFRGALDTSLRADADILMIGEMRETETMRSVMTAAEVGHLTLSTIHANSTYSTVFRIIDSFEANQQRQIANQLASSLIGICSIRLLPKVSGGLVPACEILLNTPATANLIRENRIQSIKSAIQTGKEEGMISLEQSLATLVKDSMITLETAQLYAENTSLLQKYL